MESEKSKLGEKENLKKELLSGLKLLRSYSDTSPKEVRHSRRFKVRKSFWQSLLVDLSDLKGLDFLGEEQKNKILEFEKFVELSVLPAPLVTKEQIDAVNTLLDNLIGSLS
jgi:hypothetical protein